MRRHRQVAVLVAVLSLAPAAAAWADPTDDYVREQMKRQNIPGLALAVVRNGTIVKVLGYGVADLGTKIPVSPETVFKIGSVSKQFVASAIMLLAQEGRLAVDDPVSRHIPDVPPAWRPITIRHLLTHTAGLVREPPAFNPDVVQSDEELVRSAYSVPLRFAPGEKWEYSNLGYGVLVHIVSRVSGLPWSQFIRNRVFTPAGMLATRTTTKTEPVANRARGYTDNDTLTDAADWAAVRPGGAFLSNVLDLARWDAALYTDAVLRESTRRAMWSPVTLNDGTSQPYGFGWFTNRPGQRRLVWHGGGLPGFVSQYRRYVDDGVTIIILMNSDDVDDETIAFGVAELHLPEQR
jgi:CubicO group peptidase (beta-lactamase class C family)